jgi:hypothetical protein
MGTRPIKAFATRTCTCIKLNGCKKLTKAAYKADKTAIMAISLVRKHFTSYTGVYRAERVEVSPTHPPMFSNLQYRVKNVSKAKVFHSLGGFCFLMNGF